MTKIINCQTVIDFAQVSLGKLTPEGEKELRNLTERYGATFVLNSIGFANFQRKYREEPISLPEFLDRSATTLTGWIEMCASEPKAEENPRLFPEHTKPHREIW